MIGTISVWGVLIGAVIAMIIGSVWYSPLLFGKRFMALMKVTNADMPELQKNAGPAYAWSFVAYLVLSFILQVFIHEFDTTTFLGGATIAIVAWLGFMLPISLTTLLYENRPRGLFNLNLFYHLVLMIIIGGVIGVWF